MFITGHGCAILPPTRQTYRHLHGVYFFVSKFIIAISYTNFFSSSNVSFISVLLRHSIAHARLTTPTRPRQHRYAPRGRNGITKSLRITGRNAPGTHYPSGCCSCCHWTSSCSRHSSRSSPWPTSGWRRKATV